MEVNDHMSNEEIRMWMHKNGVRMWEVADKIGICESNFSKWWRHPLDTDKKKAVMRSVREILAERKENNNG